MSNKPVKQHDAVSDPGTGVLSPSAAAVSAAGTNASDIESAARDWMSAGQPIVMAIVIETWGSAPVPVGGMMVISGDQEFRGSVSGGCIEADVIAAAGETSASGRPQVLAFGIEHETAWRAGLACGGNIRVALIRVMPHDGLKFLQGLSDARGARQCVVAAWDLATGKVALYTSAHDLDHSMADALASGVSRVVAAASGEVFLQAFAPPPRLFIVGATHIGQHLAELASAIGYGIQVIDPRAAFTAPGRFDASVTETAWPDALLDAHSLDPFTALVTLTHIPSIDDEALALALKSDCRSIGALGSRKTHAARLTRLSALGFKDDQLKRIHAPAGLDIGAKSAGEIAVSILAEVIAAFRKPRPS